MKEIIRYLKKVTFFSQRNIESDDYLELGKPNIFSWISSNGL